MKALGSLAIAMVLIGSFSLFEPLRSREWWLTALLPRIVVPWGILLIVLAFYFGTAFARILKKPMLVLSNHLHPDTAVKPPAFCLSIRNLGPVGVNPVVRVIYLRYGNGEYLPNTASINLNDVGWTRNPYLPTRTSVAARLLVVEEKESKAPYLSLLVSNSQEPKRLWAKAIPLDEQKDLLIGITVTYRAKGVDDRDRLHVNRYYRIKADKAEPLKYRVVPVRFSYRFWRD